MITWLRFSEYIERDFDVTIAKAFSLSRAVTIVIEAAFSSLPLSVILLLLLVSLMRESRLGLLMVTCLTLFKE